MKNCKFLSIVTFIAVTILLQPVYGQSDDILCLPCIRQYITDNNITDVVVSPNCPDTYFFTFPNGSQHVRYGFDICHDPMWILPVECENLYSIGIQCPTSNNQCETEVELIEGVECVLPKVVSTGQVLNVCGYLNGVPAMDGPVGTRYKIGYQNPSDCVNFCLQGTSVFITCSQRLDIDNEPDVYSECTSLEEFQVGNIVPQGGSKFTLFSGLTSENAKITTARSSNGYNSLLIGNGSDIDYNIDQQLKESQVGRLDFKFYLPTGKSGSWGLETNDLNKYVFYMNMSSQSFDVLSSYSGVPQFSYEPQFNKWHHVSLIFQPFKNTIELWINGEFKSKYSNFTNNGVIDFNMYHHDTFLTTNEMYIDEICYREWKHVNWCTLEFDPVCVNENSYGNACFASLDGYNNNEIVNGACGVPECTALSYPTHNSYDIPTNVTIQWPASNNASYYNINVGKNPGLSDIASYSNITNTSILLQNLPASSDIYVSIVPGNSIGEQTSCSVIKFSTKSNLQPPLCTAITSPANNAVNVPRNVGIVWPIVSGATGYQLLVGTSSITADILNLNVGLVNSYVLSNLPEDLTICVRVVPYNAAGNATTCLAVCFKTEKVVQIPGCTQINSPSNNQVGLPPTVNLTWPSVAGSTGYRIRIRDVNNQPIKPDITVGNVNNYIVQDLPPQKFICVTVSPFNSAGESQNCTPICFETAKTSSTADVLQENFAVSPNPVEDYLSLSCTHCILKGSTLKIIDTQGKLLITVNDYIWGQKIDVGVLPGGAYLVVCSDVVPALSRVFIKL